MAGQSPQKSRSSQCRLHPTLSKTCPLCQARLVYKVCVGQYNPDNVGRVYEKVPSYASSAQFTRHLIDIFIQCINHTNNSSQTCSYFSFICDFPPSLRHDPAPPDVEVLYCYEHPDGHVHPPDPSEDAFSSSFVPRNVPVSVFLAERTNSNNPPYTPPLNHPNWQQSQNSTGRIPQKCASRISCKGRNNMHKSCSYSSCRNCCKQQPHAVPCTVSDHRISSPQTVVTLAQDISRRYSQHLDPLMIDALVNPTPSPRPQDVPTIGRLHKLQQQQISVIIYSKAKVCSFKLK
jgi:hypothetical protein